MKNLYLLLIFSLVTIIASSCSQNEKMAIGEQMFKHHFITDGLPDTENSRYGTPVLADFDNDGDLDYSFSITKDKVFWFENRQEASWQRHVAAEIPTAQLGGAAWDVDADGYTDIIAGGYWFRNPGNPKEQPFQRYVYDSSIDTEIHDMVIADMDGDGKEDVVVLGDREGCYWYAIPSDAKQDTDWPRTTITMAVLNDNDDIHAGFFPNGIGDLDADGDNDVVMPDRWYANSEAGKKWQKHDLPWGKVGPWGLSSRSWIVDLDLDGDNDVVILDNDQQDSRAAWLENDGSSVPEFSVHRLPLSAPGVRGSFHSLALADFDADGDLDIFTIEQQDNSILPQGAPPRAFIWENLDGKGGQFAERVVFDGKLGGHDARIGDVDGDGDIDICFKVWKRWPESANEGRVHADFLENQLK